VLVPDNPDADRPEAARNAFEVVDWAHKNGGAAAEALECPEGPESAHRHIHEVRIGAKDPSGRPKGSCPTVAMPGA